MVLPEGLLKQKNCNLVANDANVGDRNHQPRILE